MSTTPTSKPNTIRRYREVRDVYNKLRKKYRADAVEEFIRVNYFLERRSMYSMLTIIDNAPVEEPSLIYKHVMREDFSL